MKLKKSKAKKQGDQKIEEDGEEAMDVESSGDGGFKTEKDKEEWDNLLKSCGLSNQNETKEAETVESNVEVVEKKPKKQKKKKTKKAKEESSTEENENTKVNSSEPNETNNPSVNKEESSTSNTFANHGNLAFCKLNPPDRTFYLIKQKENKWFELLDELSSEILTSSTESEPLNEYWSEKMDKYATKLHQKEEETFKNLSMKSSQYAWSEKILSSTKHGGGTLKDKLNIHTVRLQESPLHHLKSLETLIAHVNLKSRRPMSLSMDILTEIFTSHLLVPGRKLRSFLKNPFKFIDPSVSPEKRDRLILLWHFESQLKEYYSKFLDALKEVSMDQIEKTKVDAMSKTLTLLIANPELENVLLERLVNKLGDPVRSVASRAIHQLSTLLEKHHPAMKIIVVKEVERLMFRNNVNPKAQYYGICFLSQIMLSSEGDEEIAKKLIRIYFSFFKSSIKKGEIDSKLMSGLLTGVNRAIPYAKDLLKDSEFQSHVGTLYKVVHMSSFNIAIQALSLLFQTDGEKERYYTAIYKKTLSHDLVGSSKQALFFNLIFKTLKGDPEVKRVRAFAKRLLQVSSLFKPPLTCAILFLISEVVKARPELNLLARESINLDMNAFDEDDEGEERYVDAPDASDDDEKSDSDEESEKKSSSWVHKNNISRKSKCVEYDPCARNPLYAGAELSHLWELNYLMSHYHPSVSLFACNVSSRIPISYSGDPLADFTLIRFLDRFVFRNPKKQPSESSKKPHPLSKKESQLRVSSFESSAYIQADESTIPEDELFIYKYLKQKSEKKMSQDGDESFDNDSVTSEEFDKYLDRMADFGDNEDIDFANNVSQETVSKKGGKKRTESHDSSSSEEEESDVEDDMELEDDDPSFSKLDASSGDDDSSEFDEDEAPKKKKRKKEEAGDGLQSLLASAEEFAEMIENDETNLDAGGSSAVSNKDNSGLKQLKWEKSRSKKGSFKKKKKMTAGIGRQKGGSLKRKRGRK